MSQPSIASYFNTRKRPATEELNYTRTKVFLAENDGGDVSTASSKISEKDKDDIRRIIYNGKVKHNLTVNVKKIESNDSPSVNSIKNSTSSSAVQVSPSKRIVTGVTTTTRSGRTIKRVENSVTSGKVTKEKVKNDASKFKQQNLVNFVKRGSLSNDVTTLSPQKNAPAAIAITSKNNAVNVEKGSKTHNQNESKASTNLNSNNSMNKEQLNNLIKKELNFDEVKSKITRSAKLQEFKASINRLKELEKARKAQEEKSKRLKNGTNETATNEMQANLKKFETIELEVLTSPQKGFKTPTKPVSTSCAAADNNRNKLMSPKKTETPKRILFSPNKEGILSPSKQTPAYQRFQNLVETGKSTLQLPYKYRYLIEMFRCVDTMCAMFYNRKETITFKKLKPSVQRMARKNFTESHLAQIKHIYPDAFHFAQIKTRNFGSTTKQDYFQLVITPIVNNGGQSIKNGCCQQLQKNEDNVLKSAEDNPMNPKVMTERLQKFSNILLNIVKDEHDKFLKSLDPPLNIPKDKITRWHPDFDLEKCPDIEEAILPQPPNIEKFSSAKDVLSMTRNLFNCSTPLERAMMRLEERKKQQQNESNDGLPSSSSSSTTAIPPTINAETQTTSTTPLTPSNPVTNSILKGVPKSLLDKIRAKQAANILHSMTRRQSEDREATKYSRLPELARHLRNIFITEKKSVLPLEIILKRVENSYRTILTHEEIESHLKLIEKEVPQWISFHEIRKTMYLKLNREMDLSKITETLANIANEKFK